MYVVPVAKGVVSKQDTPVLAGYRCHQVVVKLATVGLTEEQNVNGWYP